VKLGLTGEGQACQNWKKNVIQGAKGQDILKDKILSDPFNEANFNPSYWQIATCCE